MDHQGDTRQGSLISSAPLSLRKESGSVVYQAFHLDGRGIVDVRQQDMLVSASARDGQKAIFRISPDLPHAQIELLEISKGVPDTWRLAGAVFEYLFSAFPALQSLNLGGEGWSDVPCELACNGIALHKAGTLAVRADMFWQTPGLWTPPVAGYFPRHDIYDGKVAHPLRPPKPEGMVYARFIPWLGGVFSLDVATLNDLPDIHRWMNDPRVNEFWHEAGDEDRHRRYLDVMFADPHIMPLIGRFEGRAFSYFEVYWAREDIVGTFCDAGDYDRGCHVIVGDETCRGRDWFTAWLPSLLHYMFLDDPRTERIVQEPSSEHHRQLRNLQKSGFSHVKSVDLPTKHAAIMAIGRQRFFADRLWHAAE